MTEREITEQRVEIPEGIQMEVAAAMSHHVTAKSIAGIDEMKQVDTMQRLLNLATTREGLAALISLKKEHGE